MDAWVDQHADLLRWAGVLAANLGAVAASWPLTLLRGGAQSSLERLLETSLVVGLSLTAFVPILELRDDLQRATAFLMQVELVSRVAEVCTDDLYLQDHSLGQRMLHILVPPEDLASRRRVQSPGPLLVGLASEICTTLAVAAAVALALEERASALGGYLWALHTSAVLHLNGLLVQTAMLLGDGTLVAGFMDRPYAASSVRDFWTRWNRPIHLMLKRHVFLPVQRRHGKRVAAAATFAASGLYHVAHIWVGGRHAPVEAAAVLLYFAVQAAAVSAELRMRVARWPEHERWAWTASCVLLPLPLFTWPYMRLEGL